MPGAKVWDPTPAGGSLSTARGKQNPSADGASLSSTEVALTRALVSGAGNAAQLPWSAAAPAPIIGTGIQRARVVRAFAETSGLTASAQDANITVAMTAESSAVLGGTALKLAIVNAAGAARYVDVLSTTSAVSLPNFKSLKQRLVCRAAFSDSAKISQFELYYGTSGLSRFVRARRFPHSMDKCNEGRAYGFHGSSPVSDTLLADDTVVQYRIRVYVNAGQSVDAYIDGVYLPEPTLPFVVWTIDDDDDSMLTYASVLAARGMRATFGINNLAIGTGGKITYEQIGALAAAGHEVSSHNTNNSTITTLGLAAYIAEHRACKWDLYARGYLNGQHYHPWVQGDSTAAGAAALRAEGVRVIRGVSDEGAEPLFRHQNLNEVPVRSLGSAIELAAMLTHLQGSIDCRQDLFFMAHKIEGTTYADSVTWPVAATESLADAVAAGVAAGTIAGAGTVGDWLRYRGLA